MADPVLSPLAQHLTAALAGVTELERQHAINRLTIDNITQDTIELRSRVSAYEHIIGELQTQLAAMQAEALSLRAEIERLKSDGGQQPAPTPEPKPGPTPTPEPSPQPSPSAGSHVVIDFGPFTFSTSIIGTPAGPERWKSERRWVWVIGDTELAGIRCVLDVHDSGQVRVVMERCDVNLPHTAPVITARLRVTIDGTVRHDAPLRVHHHCRPPLVFNRREHPGRGASALVEPFATADNAKLVPRLTPATIPETELTTIAAGRYPWDRWHEQARAKNIAYDAVSEQYGQVVRSWTGGAGPFLNEAAMLSPIQVVYLFSRDPRAWREVVQLADSSGNYAVHYRLPDGRFPRADETGGLPFLQGDPHVTLTTAAGMRLPVPDVAHQHSLTYLAYLLTGERYYFEELQAWCLFNLLTRPKTADRLKGIIHSGQIRSTAWALRALLHATLASESGSADRTRYEGELLANLNWLNVTFTTSTSPHYRASGLVHLDPWRPSGMLTYVRAEPKPQWTGTWMSHVLCHVLNECVRAGYEEAIPMRDHLLRVAQACWRWSPTKHLAVWGNHAVPAGAANSADWPAIINTTFAGMPADDPHRTAWLDPVTSDYVAWYRAAVVAGVDAGQPWAREALTWIDAEVVKSRWKALPYEWRIQPSA